MLFIDYSSAFNTIVPTKLITKLRTLGLNTSICNWILDFLMGRPQILNKFYSCTIESILTGCIPAWYGNCSASDCKVQQRIVRMVQYITGAKLPDIQDLHYRSIVWGHF